MSTTKIFILVGVIVAVIFFPLFIMYLANPAIFGNYTGLIENIIIDLPAGYMVALVLDYTFRRREEKEKDRVAQVGLSETAHVLNRLMTMFASMVKAASDGFQPTTFEELFSSRSAELFSLHLKLNANAPSFPLVPWSKYLKEEANFTFNALTSVLERYSSFLSSNTIEAVANLRDNDLLHILQMFDDAIKLSKTMGVQYPVLNISPNALERLLDSILTSVKTIQAEATRLRASMLPRFPNDVFRTDVAPKIGDSRYEGEPGQMLIIGSEFPPSKA